MAKPGLARHVSKAYGYVRIRILLAFTVSVSVRVLRPPSVPSSEAAALKPIPTDFSPPHEFLFLFLFLMPGGSAPRLASVSVSDTWGVIAQKFVRIRLAVRLLRAARGSVRICIRIRTLETCLAPSSGGDEDGCTAES